eukprot:ANDGO_01712.mRNA.1 Bifunctional dihydrofolate reductase-thymidylate synthase
MAGYVSAIVACTPDGGIGFQNKLPFAIPADLSHFRKLTSTLHDVEPVRYCRCSCGTAGDGTIGGSPAMQRGFPNVLIMGRKTFQSINRVLPNRISIVVSANPEEAAKIASAFAECRILHKVEVSTASDTDILDLGGEFDYANRNEATGKHCLFVAPSPIAALQLAKSFGNTQDKGPVVGVGTEVGKDKECSPPKYRIWICGGASIYESLLPYCSRVYQTLVLLAPSICPCDAFLHTRFPNDVFAECSPLHPSCADFGKWLFHDGIPYRFYLFQRTAGMQEQHPESLQYLSVARQILEHGTVRTDRTGVGTIQMFGTSVEFNLSKDGFPLLTTKRVYWKGVVRELLWFISGCTDAKVLTAQNVHIWDGNGSRAFLDKLGLKHRREGDLGPVYGFQWRHFGAAYTSCDDSYNGKNNPSRTNTENVYKGIDQLGEALAMMRSDPNSRRNLVSAWNPAQLKEMALPPCHVLFQFNVDGEYVDLQMYQRSADWFLGVPFNIASYALLLVFAAHLTQKKPRKLRLVFGDSHIYRNHVDQVREQLSRDPRAFPTVTIKNRGQTTWEDFLENDVLLEGYCPHPPIKGEMAV